MVAVLRCVRPQFQWYRLAYATEIKSIQLHDSYRRAQPKDRILYIYYIKWTRPILCSIHKYLDPTIFLAFGLGLCQVESPLQESTWKVCQANMACVLSLYYIL